MSETVQPRFPTTCWGSIDRAMQSGEGASDALGQLLSKYLTPLRAHLTSRFRIPRERVDDLLQAFIASDKVLERDLIASAVPEKGRFRTFLLVSVDRFVLNQLRNETRQRRSPGTEFASITDMPDPGPGPDRLFEMASARQVLALAAERMQVECRDSGREDIWGIFDARVLIPALEGAVPIPFEQLVQRYKLSTSDEASNLLVTAKRIFVRNLRLIVREYLTDESEVEAEIADLRVILARIRN